MNNDWVAALGVIAVIGGAGFIFYTALRRSKEAAAVKVARQAISYPLQLQAAERMILYLERIKPQNLLTRINAVHLSPTELQQAILQEIRSELDHMRLSSCISVKKPGRRYRQRPLPPRPRWCMRWRRVRIWPTPRPLWSVYCRMKMKQQQP